MAGPHSQVEFSLDCELIWGMPIGIKERYLKNNVANAHKSLEKIVSKWDLNKSVLHLAFVGKTLPEFPVNDDDKKYLTAKGYSSYFDVTYLKFDKFEFELVAPTVKLGLHGLGHRLYTELLEEEKKLETAAINEFLKTRSEFNQIFVYPKNLADEDTVEEYKNLFLKIRVNSISWLYRTRSSGVGKLRRVLRYLDSFLPIFELFCDKRPEHNLNNAIVGTHFFRANLPPTLLFIHYLRLKIGIKIMSLCKKDVHVWSHPHNFAANPVAIEYFCDLAK